MWPAILAGAGLAMSALQNAQKAKQAKAQMMMRASEQETAPWTGQPVQTQATFDSGNAGNLLQGAVSGYASGAAIDSAANKDAMNKEMLDLRRQEVMQGGMQGMQQNSGASTLYNDPMKSKNIWSGVGRKVV